jgi:hypothetical protein
MNIHFPRTRIIMGLSVEFGCADVPAVAWSRISSMNVIGHVSSAECCMPGMSCIVSSGFADGVGLPPCRCCDDGAFWPKIVDENRMSKIIKSDKNERFMSILYDPIESSRN